LRDEQLAAGAIQVLERLGRLMTTTTMLPGRFVETMADMLETGSVQEMTSEEVSVAISMCVLLQGIFSRARRAIEEGLSQGVDGCEFVAKYERAVTDLEEVLTTAQRVVAKARMSPLSPSVELFISNYGALMDDMLSLRQFLAEAVAKAKQPVRPIDWNRVQEAEAAYARGETKPFQRSAKS
jgi:hypothetical protein